MENGWKIHASPGDFGAKWSRHKENFFNEFHFISITIVTQRLVCISSAVQLATYIPIKTRAISNKRWIEILISEIEENLLLKKRWDQNPFQKIVSDTAMPSKGFEGQKLPVCRGPNKPESCFSGANL